MSGSLPLNFIAPERLGRIVENPAFVEAEQDISYKEARQDEEHLNAVAAETEHSIVSVKEKYAEERAEAQAVQRPDVTGGALRGRRGKARSSGSAR
jgi:hypothetical protein